MENTGIGELSDWPELSDDDEKSLRVASLALAFMNSPVITDDQLWETYYPDVEKRDTFRVTFRRDRATLAACGIVLDRETLADGSPAWRVNEGLSFADATELSNEDALAVDIACLPLVDNPDFPYGDELRIALAKIDRSFDEPSPWSLAAQQRGSDRVLDALRSCWEGRIAAHVGYTDAAGVSSDHMLAPLGFFGLHDRRYLVAARVGEDGRLEEGSVRRYRIDRIRTAKAAPKVAFEVPDDFDIGDWISLPFQIGPTACTASVFVPERSEEELRRDLERLGSTAGTLEAVEGGLLWRVDVSSVEDAAAWAIAEGIVPREPSELVSAYRRLLEGALHGR